MEYIIRLPGTAHSLLIYSGGVVTALWCSTWKDHIPNQSLLCGVEYAHLGLLPFLGWILLEDDV